MIAALETYAVIAALFWLVVNVNGRRSFWCALVWPLIALVVVEGLVTGRYNMTVRRRKPKP